MIESDLQHLTVATKIAVAPSPESVFAKVGSHSYRPFVGASLLWNCDFQEHLKK